MDERIVALKKLKLGAHRFVQKSEDEMKQEIAQQELESRNKAKGATNATKEDSK